MRYSCDKDGHISSFCGADPGGSSYVRLRLLYVETYHMMSSLVIVAFGTGEPKKSVTVTEWHVVNRDEDL